MRRILKFLVLLALATSLFGAGGCEYLPESEAAVSAVSGFPGAGLIVARAKSIDMSADRYLKRMYDVKYASIESKYTVLVENAPDNQKNKYVLEQRHQLEKLELAFKERKRQILSYE